MKNINKNKYERHGNVIEWLPQKVAQWLAEK